MGSHYVSRFAPGLGSVAALLDLASAAPVAATGRSFLAPDLSHVLNGVRRDDERLTASGSPQSIQSEATMRLPGATKERER